MKTILEPIVVYPIAALLISSTRINLRCKLSIRSRPSISTLGLLNHAVKGKLNAKPTYPVSSQSL